ncbi:MAG: beta-lactamase family protein [Acidobacteriota bacterium]|nr:beta-lactamase family protein [Acidobacteriota bacterium]
MRRPNFFRTAVWRGFAVGILFAASAVSQPNSANELAGLWEARLGFGPHVRGPLTIARDPDAWRGEIAGRVALVKLVGDTVTLTLPGGEGSYTGRFDDGRTRIVGHWIQPATVTSGNPHASPVTLTKSRENLWRGNVVPLDDEYRMYLKITPREDGSVAAFLRNPERNLGRFIPIDSVEREGETVRFFAAPAKDQTKPQMLVQGIYRDGLLSVGIPRRGGTYDFRRVEAGDATDFHPRGRPQVPYVYRPPRPRDDGWPVASVEDVGIARDAISRFIQMIIDTPIDAANAIEMHGVLIARHGKLVVEEYFHGEHADKPHDTRSASKSLTSTLVGAAIEAGVPLSASSSVYAVMNGGKLPPGLEPRRRALTLENLLTMTSGFYCDDNDPKAPGNEETIADQTDEPDYYKLALKLPMESDPGTHPVYCSISPHLAGGVLSRAAGKSLPVLFHELIAEPMQIKRYHMNLSPSGDAYMGGGMRFLPRDFMKLAQLHMNGGTWNGRRILSEEWARRATSPLQRLGRRGGYGYLWWLDDRPYKGRIVKTYLAGGNGSQIAMAVPELDLVIGFWGGNYSGGTTAFIPQDVYLPEWILPAVQDKKNLTGS